MSNSVTAIASSGPAPAKAASSDQVQNRNDAAKAGSVDAKSLLNAAIVSSTLNVSLGAKDDPMALLLKSALTGVNEALKGQLGENAVEQAAGQDQSAEATAGRIVALSTAFYDAFRQQHAGEDQDVVLQKFLTTIRGGVEQGFKEARDILKGLSVLSGGIADTIDQTEALVRQGYADFEAAQRQGGKDNASTDASTSVSTITSTSAVSSKLSIYSAGA